MPWAKMTAETARELARQLLLAADRYDDPSFEPHYDYEGNLLAPLY